MTNTPYNAINLSQPLRALPAYFGGKRKLIDDILEDIYNMTGSTLVDPMGGSMVIPVAAKHLGFKVVCNDRMAGPYTIAKALVENNNNLIDLSVVPTLITESEHDHFVDSTYGGIHLPHEIAQQVDNIYGHIATMEEEKRAPYLLLLYRYIIFMAPFQQYRYKKLVNQFYDGTYYASMQHHIDKWNNHIQDPLPTLSGFAEQINAAVVDGYGRVYQEDVFDFLNREIEGDILYLDPPYFGATLTYEACYHVADSMLLREETRPDKSSFNKRDTERDSLYEILEHIKRFKLGIFSYWSKEHSLEWFEELFEEVGLKHVNKFVGHTYVYSTKINVNNTQAGQRTDWSGDRRKEAGQQEILYFLKAK